MYGSSGQYIASFSLRKHQLPEYETGGVISANQTAELKYRSEKDFCGITGLIELNFTLKSILSQVDAFANREENRTIKDFLQVQKEGNGKS